MGRAFHVRRITVAAVASVALLAISACTVHQTDTPGLAGPSEFATSIDITATPDHVRQDGVSQSTVVVRARDASGQPIAAMGMRFAMAVGGTVQDFGTLSARNGVTGSDGRATVVYTAPAFPEGSSGSGTTIEIVATNVGTNAQTAQSQSVAINLIPPGVILPAGGEPIASFVVSPTPVSVGVTARFDATSSVPGLNSARLTAYSWSFGDGSGANTSVANHAFAAAGTYSVTLTVTNDRGFSASSTQSVTAGTTTVPTAAFVFSPADPQVGQVVFFNAATSTAASGRRLASYAWNFGDGVTKSGVTTTHDFDRAGAYAVTLTVTDDLDQTRTDTQTVTVVGTTTGGTAPTAAIVVSPTSPQVGQLVSFTGAASKASTGRTLVQYAWSFGDGGSAVGVTATHTFISSGTYVVTLTVTDSSGERDTAIQTLVFNTAPTAAFVVSPTDPQIGQAVSFNAASSTPTAGRTIVSYVWNFGDSPGGTGVSATHTYLTAGTYTITLVVTDNVGQTGTSASTLTVSGSTAVLVPEFNFSPTEPLSNILVSFNANLSVPQASISSYEWDFGDGTVVTGRTTPLIDHTYFVTVDTTFTVRLTVRDAASRGASIAHTIQVRAGTAPIASFTVTPSPATLGATVTFNGASSTSSATIVRYVWDFGDGSLVQETLTPTVTHVYLAAAGTGNKVIRLTVTDTGGLSGSTTRTLLIQ